MRLINAHEFEIHAKNILNPVIYDYVAAGAGDENTLKQNIEVFKKIYIKPRVLCGIDKVSTDITLFGSALTQPLVIAPMAFHSLVHKEGELETVKAANQQNVVMCLSTMSSTQLELVSKGSSCLLWFQLYVHKDRKITLDLIQRAESAGYKALMITVDMPVMGRRERDIRNQFKLPIYALAKNYSNKVSDNEQEQLLKNYTDSIFDPSLSWKDIEWLSSKTKLPVILKGIMNEGDAKNAINSNVSAIVVSNHGGRQLDGIVTPMHVLPAISDIIQGRIPILIDGGFRRGVDVFKALALGADCIMIGRPILWALAVNGCEGVKALLEIYNLELKETMLLSGCASINHIKKFGPQIVQTNY